MSGNHTHECDECGGYWPCDDYDCDVPQHSPCAMCKYEKELVVARARIAALEAENAALKADRMALAVVATRAWCGKTPSRDEFVFARSVIEETEEKERR